MAIYKTEKSNSRHKIFCQEGLFDIYPQLCYDRVGTNANNITETAVCSLMTQHLQFNRVQYR